MRPNPAGPQGVRPFSAAGAVRPFKCRLAGPDRLRGGGEQGGGRDCGGGGLLKHLSPEAFFPGTLFHLLLLFSQTPYLNAKVATPQCPPNSSLHPKLSLVRLSVAATPAMGQEWGKVASSSEPAPRSPQRAPRRSQPEGGHAAG